MQKYTRNKKIAIITQSHDICEIKIRNYTVMRQQFGNTNYFRIIVLDMSQKKHRARGKENIKQLQLREYRIKVNQVCIVNLKSTFMHDNEREPGRKDISQKTSFGDKMM